MEIKILCPCGAKFKFDVEPVNGQSPGAVSCPVCGADSTAATNALIAQQLAAAVPKTPVIQPISVSAAPSAAPASSSSSTPNVSIPAVRIPTPAAAPGPIRVSVPAAAAPAPSAPVPASSAAPMSPKMTVMPVPEGGRALSVKPPGEATTHETPPSAAPSNAAGDPKAPGSPKMAFMPAPAAGSGSALSVAGALPKPEASAASTAAPMHVPSPAPSHPARGTFTASVPERAEGNFTMGVIGAIVGCLIGAGLWYFLAVNVVEGWRILAWIPGIIGGFLAILLAKRPSEKLGIAAAVIAGVITIATQFAVIGAINDKRLTEASEENYRDMMAVAKKAADAKTDLQVKEVMDEDPEYGDGAAHSVKELLEKLGVEMEKAKKEEAARASGQTMSDEQKAEVEDYRKKRLPELIKFSKGDPSRTRYLEQQRARLAEDGYILYRKKWFWMGVWIFSSIQSAFYFGRGKKS